MNSPFLDWALPLAADQPDGDEDDDIGYVILDDTGQELFGGLDQENAQRFVDAINGYLPLIRVIKTTLGELKKMPDEIANELSRPIEDALAQIGALPNKGRWTNRAVLGDVVEYIGEQWLVEDACVARPEVPEPSPATPVTSSNEPGWRVSLRKLDNGQYNPTGESLMLWQTGPGTERLFVIGKMQRLFVRTTG